MCIEAAADAQKDEAERVRQIEFWEQKVDSIFDEIVEMRIAVSAGGRLGGELERPLKDILSEIEFWLPNGADLDVGVESLADIRSQLLKAAERALCAIEWCDAKISAAAEPSSANLYAAYCYASGEIDCGLANKVPDGAIAFAVAPMGPEWEELWLNIHGAARTAYNGCDLLVPGVPEAEDQSKEGDALAAWIAKNIPPKAYEAAMKINARSLEAAQ